MPEIAVSPDEPLQGVTLTGSFECHTCYEYVWEATYVVEKAILTWTCPAGHVTKIEYHYG